MLRAEQLALIQEANQQLLNIRELELDYFTDVFSGFSIISGLVSGFTLSALTQVPAKDANVHDFWKWLFWICCTICMSTSLHTLLTTTFVNIYGSGLALRGPSGSMVRAVEGMMKEKDAIFVTLIASIAFFQLLTLAVGFLVMTQEAAIVCSIMLAIGSYYWYKYCIRIYNRFKIHKVQFAWQEAEEGPHVVHEDSNAPQPAVPMKDERQSSAGNMDESLLGAKGKKKSGLMNRLLGTAASRPGDRPNDLTVALPVSRQPEGVNRMEGYLTFKETKSKMFSSSEAWTRQYFVIEGADMYYYRKKEDFILNPANSVRNRPISLVNHTINSNVMDDGTYTIKVAPEGEDSERKCWFFRCDTAEELQAWGEAFARATGMSQA